MPGFALEELDAIAVAAGTGFLYRTLGSDLQQ